MRKQKCSGEHQSKIPCIFRVLRKQTFLIKFSFSDCGHHVQTREYLQTT